MLVTKYEHKPEFTETISGSVSLSPRLEYSANMLDEAVTIIQTDLAKISDANREEIDDLGPDNPRTALLLETEQKVSFSLLVALEVQKKIHNIHSVHSIIEILPSTIPVIRTISAKLFDILPACSAKLSEISVQLGSIVLDSAILTKASFDFCHSSNEWSSLFDEAKLIADSKLCKQYPNVDFLKGGFT